MSGPAIVTKKKRIVNIQVKPESNMIRSSMQSINYPETTKDQASKSFEKLKKKQDSNPAVLRPRTAAGIVRVSNDENSSSSNNQPRSKPVFSYFKRADKENRRDNSVSKVNKSLSHN